MRTIAGTAAGRARGIEIIGLHGIPYAAPAGRPAAAADAASGGAGGNLRQPVAAIHRVWLLTAHEIREW